MIFRARGHVFDLRSCGHDTDSCGEDPRHRKHGRGRDSPGPVPGIPARTGSRAGFVLMTLHRRESFGPPMRDILLGVKDFLEDQKNARVVWARHPTPAIREMLVKQDLQGLDRFRCVPPLEFPAFVQLLSACRIVLTDSGGIQGEAPSLGKRVLIAREATERPEAVDRGLNRLIGKSGFLKHLFALGRKNRTPIRTATERLPIALSGSSREKNEQSLEVSF